MASPRFQRWALYLSGFLYKIKFVKGQKNSVLDMLSRHPMWSEIGPGQTAEVMETSYVNLVIAKEMPVTHTAISQDTRRDPTLSKVVKFVTDGWPEEKTNDILKPLVQRKDDNLRTRMSDVGLPSNSTQKSAVPLVRGTTQQ